MFAKRHCSQKRTCLEKFWLCGSAAALGQQQQQEHRVVPVACARGNRIRTAPQASPESIFLALSCLMEIKDKRNLRSVLLKSLRFWYPHDWEQRARDLAPYRHIPSYEVRRRAILKLDIAMMLDRREVFRVDSNIDRYLAFDASPQAGGEVMASVERVTRRSGQVSRVSASEVEIRTMPLVMLGQGRTGSADKTAALVHQTFLEYGPSVQSVRAANMCVRQCLTDMGTELAVVESRDAVGQILGQPGLDSTEMSYMFPFALQIPGPQHILDGALKKAMEDLEWWPAFSAQLRAVANYVRSKGHRTALKAFLVRGGHGQNKDMLAELNHRVASFARWRWTSLEDALIGLL